MKKILLVFALLIQLGSVVGQVPTIFVSGQITDASTGNPVVGHPVTITVMYANDSLDAVTTLVETGPLGNYDFSTPFEEPSAIVDIATPDCNGMMMSASHSVNWNNSFIVQDFSFCQSGGGCQANFYYEPLNPISLSMGFYDLSFGNHDSWFWDFGDGNSSAEPNPVHTYLSTGLYEVCLTISSADSSCYDMFCLPVIVGNDTTQCNAMFSYSQVGTNNTTISFIDLSMGNPTNWLWEFGDGTSSSEQNPIHAYNSQGLFEVCLTISDPNSNCFSTFCMPVMVGSDSNCVAVFEYYPAVNNNLEIAFIDMSFGNHDTWFWDFGDNNFSTVQNPFHAYQTEGVYNVCLTISSSDGVCISTSCKYVVVNDTVNCMSMFSWFPADSLPNTNQAIQFIDNSLGQSLDWNWDFGDGTFSSEQNPLHIYGQPGNYEVCLTINGAGNCQSTWCELVTVGQGGDCYNYFTYQTAGNTVLFTGFHSTDIPAGYEWSFGDGTAGSGQQISHTYAGPGTYFVSLMTWDDNNCSATSSQVVVVGDSIIFNQVYGQVFENNFPLSAGLVMIFGINGDPGFSPYNDFVLVDSSGVFLFPYVPNGEYVLYAIPLNFNGYLPTYYGDVIVWDDATTIELGEANNPYNINLLPIDMSQNQGNGTISGLITVSADRSGMVDKVKVLLFNSTYQALGFTNVHADGTFGFDNLADGTYYIYPELPGMTSGYIRVDLTASHNQANVYMNMTEDAILGSSEISASNVSGLLYPNPAVNQTTLTVYSNKSTNSSVMIYDLSGRIVMKLQVKLDQGNNNFDIPVDQLQHGVYFFQLTTSDGEQLNQRLIKN